MHLGLDLRALEPGFKAHFGRGTGRYAAGLSRELAAIELGSELTVTPFSSKALGASRFESKLLELLPLGRVTFEQQLLVPRRIKRLEYDALHFLSHVDAPARCPLPYLLTVLDLIPLKFPELYQQQTAHLRFKLARALELRAIRRAAGILTISEASKRDIVELLEIPAKRVVVTPLAADEMFQAQPSQKGEKEALFSKYELPLNRPIILYVGGVDPRKNLSFLIEVFSQVLAQPFPERPLLVFAGRYERDKHFPALKRKIDAEIAASDLRLIGYVEEEDLPALYRASSVMAFPSLYEGFGLPVLEAMSCGVPFVAGNNSSLPEVTGSTEYLLPDCDRAAWAKEITRLLRDTGYREQQVALGLKRKSHFSWNRTAEATVSAYRYLLGISARSQATAVNSN